MSVCILIYGGLIAQGGFGTSSYGCDTKVQRNSRAKDDIAGPRPHARLSELNMISLDLLVHLYTMLATADGCP